MTSTISRSVNNPDKNYEFSGFVYPEEIPQIQTWLDEGDTGVISGYLLPLFQIPTQLITETLGEKTLLNWIKRVLGIEPKLTRETYIPPNQNKPQQTDSTPMNEGDFHSGPEGYSPNTPYPETQYGSGFDEDAEWNEGDWR